jgi:isopentenyl diphosphate isomerase/L-lactate dehydrogenase-like FMN-dependent dehydrogenase
LWYSWQYLDDIRAFIKGPMIVKGILTAEDARISVERGYDGLVVSNHGGRSMDYGPSTLEVLPEIVDAVGGKIPVLIDSGFRRGSDVVKALALGASAVCMGRAPRWGLGAFGPQGVQRLLEIVHAEIREAMAKTGRRTVAALDRTVPSPTSRGKRPLRCGARWKPTATHRRTRQAASPPAARSCASRWARASTGAPSSRFVTR